MVLGNTPIIFPQVSVLVYHNITGTAQEDPNDIHSIPIERLQEQINALHAAGFRHLTIAEAFESLVEGREQGAGFALTFDDGYCSLQTYLREIPMQAAPTVFIITGYTGKSTFEWNTRSSVIHEHLDLEGIRNLREAGFDIQAHGVDHHNLLKFNDDELRKRFRRLSKWFGSHLMGPPEFLAYPYGYCDARVKSVVSEFFRGALSMTHGEWSGPEARFALNRVGIPFYLTGRDLVDILKTPSGSRWYEIEKRAPWRKGAT